jgi:hypothetical protein
MRRHEVVAAAILQRLFTSYVRLRAAVPEVTVHRTLRGAAILIDWHRRHRPCRLGQVVRT